MAQPAATRCTPAGWQTSTNIKSGQAASTPSAHCLFRRRLEMDAMDDEFQEADILWPEADDELATPFVTTDDMDMEEPYVAAASPVSHVAPVFRCHRFEELFLPGAASASSSAGASSTEAEGDEEEWQEADVLWPDTASVVSRGGGGGGLLWPFPGGSGRAGGRRANHPAATARRDRWRPAASSPIDIPSSAAGRRRYNLGRR
ncbi:unnamed protein product [Urochloa humidicola]